MTPPGIIIPGGFYNSALIAQGARVTSDSPARAENGIPASA